jgi:hypothetical protein
MNAQTSEGFLKIKKMAVIVNIDNPIATIDVICHELEHK